MILAPPSGQRPGAAEHPPAPLAPPLGAAALWRRPERGAKILPKNFVKFIYGEFFFKSERIKLKCSNFFV